MANLFREILFRPLLNATFWLYAVLPGNDFGLAIIVLTLGIRLLFFPLTLKTILSQRAMAAIGPKLTDIREKHKNDKNAQSAAMMQLYKEHKINPLSGCLPLLIQLPILIALYRVFIQGLHPESMSLLYSFIPQPGTINPISFGIIDITTALPVLAVVAGVLQFVQAKLSTQQTGPGGAPEQKQMQAMNRQMLYFFPIFIIIIGWRLPGGLMLYWVASTLFSIAEQLIVKKWFSVPHHGLPVRQ